MEIEITENLGFCFGVKRAIEIANNTAIETDASCKIYTYGPIIHNDIVINDLKEKGIDDFLTYDLKDKFDNIKVIIASHGVAPKVYDDLKQKNIKIIDATCPFVTKIHNLVSEYSNKGYSIVVLGDKNHTEVKGIVGYANSDVYVADCLMELDNLNLKKDRKYAIFSQTTFDTDTFKILVEFFQQKMYNFIVFDTICPSTKTRQKEVFDVSKRVDMMLIIGSSKSSNTKKLFNIAKSNCQRTYLIENMSDIKKINFFDVETITKKIGIGAGASAPEKIIKEVVKYVRNEF